MKEVVRSDAVQHTKRNEIEMNTSLPGILREILLQILKAILESWSIIV